MCTHTYECRIIHIHGGKATARIVKTQMKELSNELKNEMIVENEGNQGRLLIPRMKNLTDISFHSAALCDCVPDFYDVCSVIKYT